MYLKKERIHSQAKNKLLLLFFLVDKRLEAVNIMMIYLKRYRIFCSCCVKNSFRFNPGGIIVC